MPTFSAVAFNCSQMPDPTPVPDIGESNWATDELRGLLESSEKRREALEGKGPGLSTVTAVVVAGAVIAIVSGWSESTLIGKVLLTAVAVYASFSLVAPLYLVGPIQRPTVTVVDLKAASGTVDPAGDTARRAASAAMAMDVANQKLSNLLDAGRKELAYGFALLLAWVVLAPFAGVLLR